MILPFERRTLNLLREAGIMLFWCRIEDGWETEDDPFVSIESDSPEEAAKLYIAQYFHELQEIPRAGEQIPVRVETRDEFEESHVFLITPTSWSLNLQALESVSRVRLT